jgi:hypothetical protein
VLKRRMRKEKKVGGQILENIFYDNENGSEKVSQ